MKKWVIPALIAVALLGLMLTGIATPDKIGSCLSGLCP
jgi:hypothetical protein